jgi:hypothetical protein
MEQRLRFAGSLILAGLVIEAATLGWAHPTAFLIFLFAGGLLILAGSGAFLYFLVAGEPQMPERPANGKSSAPPTL